MSVDIRETHRLVQQVIANLRDLMDVLLRRGSHNGVAYCAQIISELRLMEQLFAFELSFLGEEDADAGEEDADAGVAGVAADLVPPRGGG